MKTIVAVAAAAMFALPAAEVRAENTVQFHGRLPVNITSPCNGENVTGTVEVHLLMNLTEQGNGRTSLVVHENLSKSELSGDLGNEYVLPGEVSVHELINTDGTYTATAVLNEILNGKGQAPNLVIKYRIRASWDGTNLTYERLVQEVACT